MSSHVSLETTRNTVEGMVEEGRWLSTFGKNVVIKAAISPQGIKALRTLEQSGIRANATLTFSASQTLLAAKAGLSFIGPFVRRLDTKEWRL